MTYQNQKENRAQQAAEHTAEMEKKYGKEIQDAIEHTVIYDVDFTCPLVRGSSEPRQIWIRLEKLDSVSAILQFAKKDEKYTAVLNFSSYKNPGGGFIGGSKAQEECLCGESFLYNVLSKKTSEFYDWNNWNKNRALYRNRGMFTPGVVFERGSERAACGVITCAAPNFSAAREYQNVSRDENSEALRDRIRFVLDIAQENEVNTLILGAYGCGVFGQSAREVAEIFKEYLLKGSYDFEQVIFAIPESRDGNYQAFADVILGGE